jgi:hypothetical protein
MLRKYRMNVPTLNEYTSDPGYFVRARPSSVESPITYQIESDGYCVIDSYGLSDGDQISWSIIQSLKSLGLLYTNESGVLETDEFEPDPDQLKETALDDQEARRLAEIIYNNIEIGEDQLKDILSILDVDPQSIDYIEDKTVSGIDFPTPSDNSTMPQFPVHDQVDVLSGETIYKTNDWWKAAILSDGYQSTEILIYLWRKDGNSWKRSQKYKAKSEEDWENEKQTIDKLLSQRS